MKFNRRTAKCIQPVFYSTVIFLVVAALLLGLASSTLAADQSSLYGIVTDDQTKLPIDGANITVSAADNESYYTSLTNGFGMFRIECIEPGTYNLEASHPAYQSSDKKDVLISADNENRWQTSLILKESFIDIFVEVSCVTTGMKLNNVPVTITGTPTDGGNDIERTDRTDALGLIQFTGLPAGFYRFSVNDGAGKIPGWESFSQTVTKEIKSTHWADVLLKPEARQITATVYGFNPVTEEDNVPLGGIVVECEGVHPDDPDIVLVPAQTGVSGIRKENDIYWDNTMAGKVIFTGLPPINWIVQGKRLGYRLSETAVVADPSAQLVPNELRLDMALQDTKLTVVINTPYNDPEMLAGLKVRLQGLKDSNTEGINRIGTAGYEAEKRRAVVMFDRILPGTYSVTVDDRVTKTVPILIDGEDIQAGKTNPSNSFSVRFTALDYMDAFADTTNEVDLFLKPLPVQFRGSLGIPNVTVEIRASEYAWGIMPEETHLLEVTTDDDGMFNVSLIPGLYGFIIPNLENYYGAFLTLKSSGNTASTMYYWPLYQIWPFSKESAEYHYPAGYFVSSGGIGGMGFSSGDDVFGELGIGKKQFSVQMYVDQAENNPFVDMVVYSSGEDAGTGYTRKYTAIDLENRAAFKLTGPEELSAPFKRAVTAGDVGAESSITGTLSGTYAIGFDHPDFELAPGSPPENTFQWNPELIPGPGYLPAAAFSTLEPIVTVPVTIGHKGLSTATMRVYKWTEYLDGTTEYRVWYSAEPDFISFSHAGNRVFKYHGADSRPYAVWFKVDYSGGEGWYHFDSTGGDSTFNIYVEGPTPSTPAPSGFSVAYDLVIEARNIDNEEETIEGVSVPVPSGDPVTTPAILIGKAEYSMDSTQQYSHPEWNFVTDGEAWSTGAEAKKVITIYMRRGHSLQGEIVNAETGLGVPGASIKVRYNNGLAIPIVADENGSFVSPYALNAFAAQGSTTYYLLDVRANGYEPYRKVLGPEDLVVTAEDPKNGTFILKEQDAIKLTPFKKPVIAGETLTMNRKGAFLPGAKKAGNQSAFNAFNADGPLTMTWSLDVGLEQKQYSVTLPAFDSAGAPSADETLVFQDGIEEVWLVDMKSFPDSSYNDDPVELRLPETLEPAEGAAFLKNIQTGAEGYENVYYRRVTDFANDDSDPEVVRATGQIKLWQLPPDLFKPAFIVVTKLGAVNAYVLDYAGTWAGKELTGARLPPWFAGMADIMGSVAGSQAMLGDGLKNALPKGKIIALPKFTANVVLRATKALDYVYSIDTQIKEGMQNKIGGVLGLSPGFMGLSLYGGVEATLKGEDREFYVQLKGGITPNSVNKGDYQPGFLKKLGAAAVLTPAPSGEVYSYDSYKFDADNNPDEVAVLYGMSGQVGTEISASIFPVLKYIPKIGPVLFLLHKSGAMDIRALTKGLVGVRSLSGFKTTFPRQEEHYTVQASETKQLRRHFLGGNEVGDPVKANDPEKTESLDIAFGFGVGMNVRAAKNSLGATGTIEIAGDDAWTGAPAMLLDVNPNGDWPIIKRARGDLRAVLTAYLSTWVAQFQKKWHWKAWPIDYQFGTESVMYMIEMEIVTERRDLADCSPATFEGESPVVVDNFIPMGIATSTSSLSGDMLLYTDVASSDSAMAIRVSMRKDGLDWTTPVEIAEVNATVVAADIIALPEEEGWLALWTEIGNDVANEFYPPSRIMYAIGSLNGTQWTTPAQVAALDNVADKLKLTYHGESIALLYSEAKEGPSGSNTGINAILWTNGAWSRPLSLIPDSVATFDTLGEKDLEQWTTLVAWVNDAKELYLSEWGDNVSDPLLLREETGSAIALIRSNNEAYLAYSAIDDGIGVFESNGGAASWTDRGLIFPDAAPREISMAVIKEDDREIIVVAWTESDGAATNMYYGVVDPSEETLKRTARVTALEKGDFRSPALQGGAMDGPLDLLGILQEEDGTNQLHSYSLTDFLSTLYGDIDMDGDVDLEDLLIILKILISSEITDSPGQIWADINRNGKIDQGDAIYILRTLAKQ